VLWRHNREPCTERQCFRCLVHHRRPPQLWRYTGLLEHEARNVDAFIAMSEFSREQHRKFGFAREMEVLPCFLPDAPIDAETTDDAADVLPHYRPYFLFVGRLELFKGLDDVIPLFARDTGADLLVAGEGTHGASLRQLADGNPHVRFLGQVTSDGLDRYYRHAIALIAPSTGLESLGVIILEAFRAGTPVIARRIGSFPEILEAAGSGELFDTPDELLAAMRRLQTDPARRAKHVRRGREAFVDQYSERAVLPRYLDIVRRAAERRGRTAVAAALDASPTDSS
jgi:glycosyltransferase involved in cell wall biosynthesis